LKNHRSSSTQRKAWFPSKRNRLCCVRCVRYVWMETGLNASACVGKQPIGCCLQPIGRSVEAVATMIACLPTQALAFEWKPGLTLRQRMWLTRCVSASQVGGRRNGNVRLVARTWNHSALVACICLTERCSLRESLCLISFISCSDSDAAEILRRAPGAAVAPAAAGPLCLAAPLASLRQKVEV